MSLTNKYASILPKKLEILKDYFQDNQRLIAEVKNSIKLMKGNSETLIEYDVEIEDVEETR
jgi:hypothetical protein